MPSPRWKLKRTPQLVLRPEVAAFAQLMEEKLRENDHKRGWKNDLPRHLLARVCDELAELLQSFTAVSDDGPHFALLVSTYQIAGAAQLLRHRGPTLTSNFAEPRKTKTTIGEAVDAANMLMMVVDVIGGLKQKKGTNARV